MLLPTALNDQFVEQDPEKVLSPIGASVVCQGVGLLAKTGAAQVLMQNRLHADARKFPAVRIYPIF